MYVFSKEETAEIEKAAQDAPPAVHTDTFYIFPDNGEKTLTISTEPPGAVLKLDQEHAKLLVKLIDRVIQSWTEKDAERCLKDKIEEARALARELASEGGRLPDEAVGLFINGAGYRDHIQRLVNTDFSREGRAGSPLR